MHALVNLVDGTDEDSAHETTIPARGKALVDTDISIAVPVGTCKFLLSSRVKIGIID